MALFPSTPEQESSGTNSNVSVEADRNEFRFQVDSSGFTIDRADADFSKGDTPPEGEKDPVLLSGPESIAHVSTDRRQEDDLSFNLDRLSMKGRTDAKGNLFEGQEGVPVDQVIRGNVFSIFGDPFFDPKAKFPFDSYHGPDQALRKSLQPPQKCSYESIWERLAKSSNTVNSNERRVSRDSGGSSSPTPQRTCPAQESPAQTPVTEAKLKESLPTTSSPEHPSAGTSETQEIGKLRYEPFLGGLGMPRNEPSSAATEAARILTPQFQEQLKNTSTDKGAVLPTEPSPGPTELPPTQTPSKTHNVNTARRDGQVAQSFEIASKIKMLLKRRLRDTKKKGTIYILEAPEFFSKFGPAKDEQWVKIGITEDIDQRRADLKHKCGITDISVVHMPHWSNYPMDMLYRIEQLCHAQLINSRRPWNCGSAKCETKLHREWFAVDKADAIRTVKLWVAFMDHQPYHPDGEALKDLWRTSLADQNKFHPLKAGSQGLDQGELLHQSLEAWIRRTVEEEE
ncbi:uncharacterized protein N0V89_010508 [Didymosphaeria variabile]|uniref:Bacteriophage T5 Orf172 DNA-binding domain-containing protein n=1 Tax=Didymosphaeria variabile TaxID=1932322 RepID=A0A9W8XD13_9PLEO|nr:uncharacterized protein N0V89_010508 [Didymosphaeria variabile]KAJ4346577.1 hypothetical protein N0V89_010508 [Didymosphaeria variabile]